MEGMSTCKAKRSSNGQLSLSLCETFVSVEHRLELYEAGMLPWDIEMTVEEPLSDDEDGVPHDVSDSESESENDSD